MRNMASICRFSRLFSLASNNCFKTINSHLLTPQNSPVHRLWSQHVAGIKHHVPWIRDPPVYQTEIPNTTEEDEKLANSVLEEINNQIATEKAGRLFAVVHICGKQFKVTTNDMIVIQGYWPPNPGDKLRLEKVLLVGSTDFSLVGKPILSKELVSVDATVIEKTFSTTKTNFKFRPRKQYRRINFCRIQFTVLRINSINILEKIGEKKEVEGLDKIF